jgi:hypothetical protein
VCHQINMIKKAKAFLSSILTDSIRALIFLLVLINSYLLIEIGGILFIILAVLSISGIIFWFYAEITKSKSVFIRKLQRYLFYEAVLFSLVVSLLIFMNLDIIRRDFLTSKNPNKRLSALGFIMWINDTGAKDILEQIIVSDNDYFDDNFDDNAFRGTIANAMGVLKLKDSIPTLKKCLNDSSLVVAGGCALTLIRLGEKEGGNWLFSKIENDLKKHERCDGLICYAARVKNVSIMEILTKPLEDQIIIMKQWKIWWEENKDYLYWSDKDNHFVIDEEAKAAGIPTEEYRKNHPWHKEENKDK